MKKEGYYSSGQFAGMAHVTLRTIRYYDKEGLLPGIQRMNGIRLFTDEDIKWLHVLSCLKNTGMPISRIREYAKLAVLGDEILKERQALSMEQRQFVKEQIVHLLFYMQELDYKERYYQKALALGSESQVNPDDYEKETGKKKPALL